MDIKFTSGSNVIPKEILYAKTENQTFENSGFVRKVCIDHEDEIITTEINKMFWTEFEDNFRVTVRKLIVDRHHEKRFKEISSSHFKIDKEMIDDITPLIEKFNQN